MNINPNEYTILVSGATGQQGGAVANHLLERGFNVRVLTRQPGKQTAQILKKRGAEIIQGDFGDQKTLSRAFEGVYGAFSIQEEGPNETTYGKAFAEAANDASIKHFIYSSASGASQDTGLPQFESKWEIEQHIRKLELPFTIFRPVFFMDNWVTLFKDDLLSGEINLPFSPKTSLQQIAVDDIGAFAALAFEKPETWKGKAVELAGDELTMSQTAKVSSNLFNRDISYSQLPWKEYEKQMKAILGEKAGEELTLMFRWVEKEKYNADIEELREKHSKLKRLKTFLRTNN